MSEQKFKPAQPVLVRDDDKNKWYLELFSYYDEKLIYPYCCLMNNWKQCLPLEGNEHLLNTTDSPKPKWQPKPGELVAALHSATRSWCVRIFHEMDKGGCFLVKEWDAENAPYQQFTVCEPLRKHFNVPEE